MFYGWVSAASRTKGETDTDEAREAAGAGSHREFDFILSRKPLEDFKEGNDMI